MYRISGGIAVLHVDDEPEFGDMAAEFIERQDERLAVETAASASEGLARLAENGFDCIVSDYDMPEENGIEFLEAVRESHPDLPFILYTGKGSEEVASEAISAGVTDYLQKASGTSQYEVLANRITNAVEQRRARHEAAQTEQRLRTIAEHAKDVLWKFSADWNELLFINSAYEEIWGRSVEELRDEPRSFLKGIHPEDRDQVKAAMADLTAGESVDIEYRVNAEEDYGRWVWVRGEPVFDDDGEVGKVVGFARDITERKAQSSRFEALIEHSMDVITVVDESGTITYESPSVERVLGYDQDELVGEDGFEYIHPEDRDRILSLFEELLTQAEPEAERATYRFKHADGHWVWLETVGRMEMQPGVSGFVLNSRDITERRERERKLEAQRADLKRYRMAIEGSTDLLAAADAEYTLLFANERYRDYHGLDPEAVGEIRLPEYLDEMWETEVRPRVDQALDGESVRYEMDRTGPDGEPRTLDIRYYPLREPDGSVTGAVAAFRDITDREQHVRKLSALHDVAEDLTHLESTQAVCERTVEASKEILAFDLSVIDLEERGMLRKTAVSDDIPPENRADMSVEEGIAGKTYRTGESFIIEDLQSHEDGNPQGPYKSLLSVAIGEHGIFQAAANAAAVFDETDLELAELLITHCESALDRIEREQALHRQNDRMEYALERTDSIIFEIDLESGKETRHGPFERIFGIRSDAVDTPDAFYSKAVHPADREVVESEQRAVLDGEEGSVEIEYRTNPANGEIRWIRASMARIPSSDSSSVIGLSTDITRLKRREAELHRQNERLEEFGSVVSHDLRNPLNVATGRLELAAEECDSEHLDGVAAAHDRMNTLIEDLLSLARAGESVGETEPVELPRLIETCWSNVETESAELVVDTDASVQADRSRLRQLFENLFRNAVEHGGSAVTITVGALPAGFYVEDDGPGIPAGERETAFEPGYTSTAGGTGFGLSIVRDIAEAHGWTIDVTAGETGGTRFEITGVESPD